MNNSENYQRFAHAVSVKTMQGYMVADRNDIALMAVLYKPAEKVNHLLHAIITIFSCGFWVIVWLILAMSANREKRVRISMDGNGNIYEERIKM